MPALTKVVRTFPSACIPSVSGGLPVEVALIAQLGHGAGDQLFAAAMARQRGHELFVDELDEPSARLAGVDFARGDATSLYSFGVGANGHPFHRHAGHRIFTAISGSGGAQLRFSSASPQQIERDPSAFLAALRYVDIPPDSLFTVRFGGDTWHQFAPLTPGSRHPAFFALSCHTNELGGALSAAARSKVMENQATIPMLTELLPPTVAELLAAFHSAANEVPTIALALDAPAGSLQSKFCARFRGLLGRVRGRLARWRRATGFLSNSAGARHVEELGAAPDGSLLREQLSEGFDHEDMFAITLDPGEVPSRSASALLEKLLDGFLENGSPAVARLMAFRNVLVKPLGLRTSPLACPVSSLLCAEPAMRFANRFPVIAQSIRPDDRCAQVILGADDKHLRFRSCAGVHVRDDRRIVLTLGTRVQFRNRFGRYYMAAIDAVHRGYVTPTLLRVAVEHARLGTHRI
ncbi:MAG TPA: DUF2867 domain-containing protein [Rudaea sp.]